MKTKILISVAILALVVLGASVVLARSQASGGVTWEYSQATFALRSREVFVSMAGDDEQQELSDLFEEMGAMGLSNTTIANEYGSRGWELVQIESNNEGDTPSNTLTFKRPLS